MPLVDRAEYICGLYTKFNVDLLRMLPEQRELSERYEGIPFFDDVEGELLYLLVREMQPRVCVEVGGGSGWSTSWIAQGLLDNGAGHLVTVDSNPLAIDHTRDNLSMELLDHIDAVCGDFRDLVGQMPVPIDFLHLDATHTESFVRWFIDEMFWSVRGTACIHDVFYQADILNPDPDLNWGICTAKPLLEYLDKHDLEYYTPANCFPATHEPIAARRRALGITNIKETASNTTLVFHQGM